MELSSGLTVSVGPTVRHRNAGEVNKGATRINAIWPKSVTGFLVKNCKAFPKRENEARDRLQPRQTRRGWDTGRGGLTRGRCASLAVGLCITARTPSRCHAEQSTSPRCGLVRSRSTPYRCRIMPAKRERRYSVYILGSLSGTLYGWDHQRPVVPRRPAQRAHVSRGSPPTMMWTGCCITRPTARY